MYTAYEWKLLNIQTISAVNEHIRYKNYYVSQIREKKYD